MQNLLFKVHQSVLCDKSIFFNDMFNMHAELSPIDGQSDDKPIVLPAQVTEGVFELFLSVCYNK